MGELLDKAMKNRTKQNAKVQDRLEIVQDEAENFEVEGEEFLEFLGDFEKKEIQTKEILLHGKKMEVYVDLDGKQTELMGKINSVARESKRKNKNNAPDIEKAMDAAIELAASLVVPEDDRPWHKATTWRGVMHIRGFDEFMEVLGELLKPYKDKCAKLGKFR